MNEKNRAGNPFIIVAFLVILAVMLFSVQYFRDFSKLIPKTKTQEPAGASPAEIVNNITTAPKEVITPEGPGSKSTALAQNESVQPAPVIIDVAEEDFLKNAYTINETLTSGSIKTRLLRVGFYNANNTTTAFRADMWVKNIGDKTVDFYIEEGRVQYNRINYSAAGGNFSPPAIDPEEERYAYVLYSNVPRSISGDIFVTVGNSRAYTPVFEDIIVVTLTYPIKIPLLSKPRTVEEI